MTSATEQVRRHLRERGFSLTHLEIRSRTVQGGEVQTTVAYGGIPSQKLIDKLFRVLTDLPGDPDVMQTESGQLQVRWVAPQV